MFPKSSHQLATKRYFLRLQWGKVTFQPKNGWMTSPGRSAASDACMVSWHQPVVGRSDTMRPRSVIIGEVLFVVAVFGTGIFLVVNGWNKDAPSSDVTNGILLIVICITSVILHGIFRAIQARRKNQARPKS